MYRIFIEIIEDWIYAIMSFLFAGSATAIGSIKHIVAAQPAPPEWFAHCAPYFQIFAWSTAGILAVFGIILNFIKLIEKRNERRNKRIR